MFYGRSRLPAALIAVPYVLSAEVIFLRKRRYLVKLDEHLVGIFVVREKPDALYVSSLAVAPECRRAGIATYILENAQTLAERIGKKHLELSVSKMNTPAQRLYTKFGFVKKEEKKWSLILFKKVERNEHPKAISYENFKPIS